MKLNELNSIIGVGETAFVCSPFEHSNQRRGGLHGVPPDDFFRNSKLSYNHLNIQWDELADGWWISRKEN